MALTKITSGVIEDGTISNADLSSTVGVTGGQIADNAITRVKVADDAINADKIADDSVTIAKISGSSAATAGTFLKQDGKFGAAGVTYHTNSVAPSLTNSGTGNDTGDVITLAGGTWADASTY